MDLVPIALTLVAVIVTVTGIALPLIRTRSADNATGGENALSDLGQLREARNEVLTAIMDLDDDLERGNILPAEHRAMRVPLVRRAASLIREIDGREHVLDEEIERAVRLRRQPQQPEQEDEP